MRGEDEKKGKQGVAITFDPATKKNNVNWYRYRTKIKIEIAKRNERKKKKKQTEEEMNCRWIRPYYKAIPHDCT